MDVHLDEEKHKDENEEEGDNNDDGGKVFKKYIALIFSTRWQSFSRNT